MTRAAIILLICLAAKEAESQTVVSYTGAALSCTGTSTAVLTFTTTGGNQGFTISGGTISGVNYLIVGGGGGGGGASGDASGGGGGGGVFAVSGTNLASGQYLVTIGVGGSGGTAGSNVGTTGGTSSFNGWNVGGGGGGGSSSPIKAGLPGTGLNGSGGGAGGSSTAGTNAGGGVGTGHNGGVKFGGGGGWGSTGGSGGSQNGAVIGGAGYATTLFSSFGSLQVGGGGGSGGDAGQYGGGSGTLNGFSLLATYGGGGAGGWSAGTTSGGSGGNGIVCVSFPYSACSGLFGGGGGGATVVFSGSPSGTLTSGTVNITGGTTGYVSGGTLNLPSAANVLSTAALGFSGSGSYVAPVQGQVLAPSNSGTVYGVSQSGTLNLPDPGLVRSGLAYGISGTGSTGALNVSNTGDSDPGVNNVLLGTGYYYAGASKTGSYAVPATSIVMSGSAYGVSGGSLGTYKGLGFNTNPGQANVLVGTPYQILGTSITGSLTTTGSGAIAVSASDVWNGVPFTTSSGTTTGALTVAASNIRYGQVVQGSGTLNAVTGTCPVPGPVRSTAPKPKAPSPKPEPEPPKPDAAILHKRTTIVIEKENSK